MRLNGMEGGSDQDSEVRLIDRARQGDAQAFGALVERYQRLLSSLVFGMLNDETGTEDTVQEAFVAAWKALPRFRAALKKEPELKALLQKEHYYPVIEKRL